MSFAQEPPVKYGVVSEEEVKMRLYPKDTSAAVVILADYGYLHFPNPLSQKFTLERVTRIKILEKGGLEWANVEIPYYHKSASSKEEVSSIAGTTYNWEKGQVVKVPLGPDAIFDLKKNGALHVKKFAMPAAKEGAVLDITYSIASEFISNLTEWSFQSAIPVAHSEFRAHIPEYYNYRPYVLGFEPLLINEVKAGVLPSGKTKTKEYRWVLKDAPAITQEAHTTTIEDYVTRIEFQMMSIRLPGEYAERLSLTWNGFVQALLEEESFGRMLETADFYQPEILKFKDIRDPVDRIAAVQEFVKNNVKWNGYDGVLATQSFRKTLASKTGNVADINLLLMAILKSTGLPVQPVLLSTRDHGMVPRHSPIPEKFNYVVGYLEIGARKFLLDATEPVLPFGMLPDRCLNEEGWMVSKPGTIWVPLQSSEKTMSFLTADVQVQPDGVLSGKGKESFKGYYGVDLRKAIQAAGEAKGLNAQPGPVQKVQREKLAIQNLADYKKPLNLEYDIVSEGSFDENGIIYLQPMLFKAQVENPFKLSTRKYPVDFGYPLEEVYMCSFTLPEGYVVEELPKNILVSLPENGGSFTYALEVAENKIKVTSKLNIAKPIFLAQEYALLKEFYNQIIAKHAEQIVLKKKV
ncbi:DUF3857 domain-containing protein [Rufibacter tibetensis]|uniref:DUF3857 domain-containing protein n=1 Tax=Rufibacter tibetensis TaxID=512763 RepID=A0A0N7HWC8_9BACT|nr:DUF3857 domain-containing protein [Rufibacter tibetensis]ALI98888.1 hypothetical protein DC20_07740 [Rufibacter tibetensis]